MDLSLALVEEDLGRETAVEIARWLVLFLQRPGGQAQFIDAPVPVTNRDHDALAQVREYALRHLDQPLSVADLAHLAGMSERSFVRHFAATTGTSPLRWLLTQRVAAAQRLLEQTDLGMDDIAHRSGFGSAVTMRQHFVRLLTVAPRDYRQAFRAPA
jgi:transcriptional regulator GlxA family with amidase domain